MPLSALLFSFLLAFLPAAAPDPEPVAYTLSPVLEAGQLTGLAVEIRFRADSTGVTRLHLPDQWASGREFWRGVHDLRVDGAAAVTEDGPAERVIRSAARTPLVVRYRLTSGAQRELNVARNETQPFRLHLTGRWFYAPGEAVFAVPEGRDRAPARFDWTGAPNEFAFASDAEHLAGAHRPAAREGVVDDVVESVLIGGRDVHVFTRSGDAAAPVRVAVRGTFGFSDTAFAALVTATLDEQRRFWGDSGSPFLVTLAPVETPPGGTSRGGSGRTDAFMLSVSQTVPLGDLRTLMAHELFHTWNPRGLGGMPDSTVASSERLGYWFSEGFTDFYAWRLLVRSGRLRPQEWADAWNAMLLAYADSPVRTAPNARIGEDFWKDYAVEKLPYQRGALLAALWDDRLRRASGGRRSLDTVLQAQRRAVLAGGARVAGGAPQRFVDVAASLGLDVSADVRRYVDAGEAILLPSDVFGPCAVVETQRMPPFDRGWDLAATAQAQAIAGLRDDSPAYAAGLRNGMVPVRREAGTVGDSRVEYALRVRDGAQERVIRFLPRGKGEITVQSVRLIAGVDAGACAKGLSGA